MIVAELFLESNESSASIDGCKSHCCMYRTITEVKYVRIGKIMYIKKNKEKMNYQLQPLEFFLI